MFKLRQQYHAFAPVNTIRSSRTCYSRISGFCASRKGTSIGRGLVFTIYQPDKVPHLPLGRAQSRLNDGGPRGSPATGNLRAQHTSLSTYTAPPPCLPPHDSSQHYLHGGPTRTGRTNARSRAYRWGDLGRTHRRALC